MNPKPLFLFFIMSATAFCAANNSWALAAETAEADNEQIVREFIAAWSRLDADELVAYFAEDGTYYNMPTSPVTGHANLRSFIHGFLQTWEKTDWEILNIVARGNLVFAERMDRTLVAGRKVDLPCVGVFEMQSGKIKIWRDYFDLATFTSGAGTREAEPTQE